MIIRAVVRLILKDRRSVRRRGVGKRTEWAHDESRKHGLALTVIDCRMLWERKRPERFVMSFHCVSGAVTVGRDRHESLYRGELQHE